MDDPVLAQAQIDEFVNDVLIEKNLPGLTDEDRPDVVAEMGRTLRELLDRAIIEAMPDDRLDELNVLLDNPETTKAQIVELIGNSGVDVKHVTTETMLRFRELYLEGPGGESA